MNGKGLVRNVFQLLSDYARCWLKGPPIYYVWMLSLLIVVAVGGVAYLSQLREGLGVTAMTNQVSWGLYISNFTFLVGVAAAAVLLIIPAYVYDWAPIKEIAVLGEGLAVSALIMCMLFVTLDLGRPERFWHLLPVVGKPNFPSSMLVWDIIVLTGYLLLNVGIPLYILVMIYSRKGTKDWFIMPLIFLSIPWAVGIHTVTAFLYNGFGGRPFWNAAILAPRFLASAFCSGPAISLLAFQLIRKFTRFEVKDEALFKIGEMICIAIGLNLFLLGCEIFKELYTGSIHKSPIIYLYAGLDGHSALVPWIWTATGFNMLAFFIFLIPKTRKSFLTLNLGCMLVVLGVWIEKGMGLIVPGFIPTPMGEIWEYTPNRTEVLISVGVFAIGLLIYTLLLKVAVAIETGEMKMPDAVTQGSSQASQAGH
jgi:Ni/Fe-hydrogenase subunit HybB-like protein